MRSTHHKSLGGLARALALAAGLGLAAFAAGEGLRGPEPIPGTPEPPPLANQADDETREVRNYPEQPPVIPHNIRDYQVDLRFNKCLTCHAREVAPEAGAPMVSVTHFMAADGMVLTEVSPRRYFCTQCHVPKTSAKPFIGNTFGSR